MFNWTNFKEKAKAVEEWLVKEMSFIRTGRAVPAILDSIYVEAYGSKMALKEVASVTLEDPRTIRVEPWDKNLGKDIERAVQSGNLGLSVNVDDKGLRIIFPELTGDRREQVLKLAKTKLEEARVSIRSVREEIIKEIENKEKAGGMGEDDKFRLKEELQKMVDDVNTKLSEIFDTKEKEIHS